MSKTNTMLKKMKMGLSLLAIIFLFIRMKCVLKMLHNLIESIPELQISFTENLNSDKLSIFLKVMAINALFLNMQIWGVMFCRLVFNKPSPVNTIDNSIIALINQNIGNFMQHLFVFAPGVAMCLASRGDSIEELKMIQINALTWSVLRIAMIPLTVLSNKLRFPVFRSSAMLTSIVLLVMFMSKGAGIKFLEGLWSI